MTAPTITISRLAWERHAACVDSPTALFFEHDFQDEARAVCGGCPVQRECRAYALATDVEGVWGGTTKQERKRLRRERRAQLAVVAEELGHTQNSLPSGSCITTNPALGMLPSGKVN